MPKHNDQEADLQRIYGDKKARKQKNREYVERLLKSAPENIIRSILIAFALDDEMKFFTQHFFEKDIDTEPIEQILCYCTIPWFHISEILYDQEYIFVDVFYGFPGRQEGISFCSSLKQSSLVFEAFDILWA